MDVLIVESISSPLRHLLDADSHHIQVVALFARQLLQVVLDELQLLVVTDGKEIRLVGKNLGWEGARFPLTWSKLTRTAFGSPNIFHAASIVSAMPRRDRFSGALAEAMEGSGP